MKMLIVIDMQNDFVDGALGTPEAQAIVPNVVRKVEQYSWDDEGLIYFTRDTHYDDYMDTMEGKKLPVPHCIENTKGWELIDQLKPHSFDFNTIDKITFGNTEWAWTIEKIYEKYATVDNPDVIDEIEIIGLVSNICVISNALIIKAILPDTKITIDFTCCAGTSIEEHNAAKIIAKSCHIDVIE